MYQLKNSHKPSYTGQKNTVEVSSHLGNKEKKYSLTNFAGGHFAIGKK